MDLKIKKNQYDTIIIGAGISGLVTGCYLVKAGMKVLIIEQSSHIGGCCTSFKRKNFLFDACVHSLESLRPGGHLSTLFDDLGIDKSTVTRNDHSNIIITPKHKISIWNDLNKTISELQKQFPTEARSINKFLRSVVIYSSIYDLFRNTQNRTYEDILNEYFKNRELKEIFKMFLGCLYEASFNISAFTAISTIREYIFDGGYYLPGGLKTFPNLLLQKFKSFGGEILLNTAVRKIIVKNRIAIGVINNNGEEIYSNNIVSNCDAHQTFFDLIGEENLSKTFIQQFKRLRVAKSAILVYLGLKRKINEVNSFHYTNVSNVDDIFDSMKVLYSQIYIIYFSPSNYDVSNTYDNQSIVLLSGVPYMNEKYWESNKLRYADTLVRELKNIMGPFEQHIDFKEVSSPIAINKWTRNHRGAFRGWAPIVSQDKLKVHLDTQIKNLLLAGHWSPHMGRGGLPMVVFTGKSTARRILEN